MVALIILNIILIISLMFLVLYIFKNNKNSTENVCVNDNECCEIESSEHKQNNKSNSENIFVGRFITDEEYQKMMENRRSDISILLEEVNNEYEHLKELNNGSKRNSER